jgi:hypothetical protein
MGSSPGEKSAAKAEDMAGRAVAHLEQTQGQYLNDPAYLLGQALGMQLMENPYVLGPEIQQAMRDQFRSTANENFQSNMKDMRNSAANGPGVRAGSTRMKEAGLAGNLANSMAANDREIMMMAAQDRVNSLMNALNIGASLTNSTYGFDNAIANAHMGSANLLGGIAGQQAQQPSPIGMALGGLGQLGGAFLGNTGFWEQ